MSWNIKFISENDFTHHVEETIKRYGEKLNGYDLKKFNKNVIDPIKLLFDKSVYAKSWDEIIENEIFRQRDKGNNNQIGYFHQNIFKYFDNCTVPKKGFDVIFVPKNGYVVNDKKYHTVYVEMKNKHNTMNSSSSSKTYLKMQNQLLNDSDGVCFLVEAIAKHSQNIPWCVSVDYQPLKQDKIRRVSLDKFYEIVTGESDAFYQVCMALPQTIRKILEASPTRRKEKDSAFEELIERAKKLSVSKSISMDEATILSVYMLAFSEYNSFNQ